MTPRNANLIPNEVLSDISDFVSDYHVPDFTLLTTSFAHSLAPRLRRINEICSFATSQMAQTPFFCAECHMNLDESNVRSHISATHLNHWLYKCVVCNHKTVSAELMRQHTSTVHEGTVPDVRLIMDKENELNIAVENCRRSSAELFVSRQDFDHNTLLDKSRWAEVVKKWIFEEVVETSKPRSGGRHNPTYFVGIIESRNTNSKGQVQGSTQSRTGDSGGGCFNKQCEFLGIAVGVGNLPEEHRTAKTTLLPGWESVDMASKNVPNSFIASGTYIYHAMKAHERKLPAEERIKHVEMPVHVE
ncbi:hypothetical protein Ddc_18167 [Ditylenchus destructor]|nr:hypothetical protein Ddc_18167 [Ditylenchus destructor]